MIDRDSPIPIYYQLKMLVKQRIESGDLPPGERLDSEHALCQKYNISRAPVRQALLELVNEGYIYRQSGRGTFVSQRAPRQAVQQIILKMLVSDVRWVVLMEHAVQRWNRRNPAVELQLDVRAPEPSEFHQVLCSSFSGGQTPDIVSLDYVWIARYARLGFLASLDELDPEFADWMRAEFEAPVLENATIDGKLYGVPVQADVTGFWYRRDWFAAEGLEPPQTWDEWLALLEYFVQDAVKERWGHAWPISFPIGTLTGEATLNLLLTFIWSAGGELLDTTGGILCDDPGLVQSLTFLRSLIERGYLPDDAGAFHWWDSPRLLAEGQAPMILGGSYEWPAIAERSDWESDNMADYLGFVPMPRLLPEQPPVVSLGGTTWAVMRESENHALALELLRMTLEEDLVLHFCEEEMQLSPLKSVNRRLATGENVWMREVVPLLSVARPRPMLEEYVQLSRFLQQMFENILVDAVPVQTALAQTARMLELLLGPRSTQ